MRTVSGFCFLHGALGAGPYVIRTGTWSGGHGIWKAQLLIREENTAVRGFYEHLGYAGNPTVVFQKVLAEDPPGEKRD